MSVFVDTNVLLRSVQPTHPLHDAAVRSVSGLIRGGESLVVTPQIIAENFARAEVAKVEQFCSIVPESIDVYTEWKRLITAHQVSGVHVHDARLVAAMNVCALIGC